MRLSAVGLLLLVSAALVWAGCAGSGFTAPAITSNPTGIDIPGKFVWLDLLTDDLPGARKFYGEMFGWNFEPVPGLDNYVTIRHQGEPLGGILEIEPKKEGERVSQWLSYVSVADVDDAVELFESRGGELHHGPLDIPGRGRVALVADAQGGYIALMRSESGDPPDDAEPGEHEFMWVDYVADDTDQAIEFLGRAFGWSSEVHFETERGRYYVFSQGDEPRAGMFENPWPHVRPNWLPYVRVADAKAAADLAMRLGATVVLEPEDEIRNGSVAIVLDPSGAGLVLQKYPF